MVNFKELLKRKLARLTPDEKSHRAKYLELRKLHMYYKGSCRVQFNGSGDMIIVRLYSHVNYHTLTVGDKVLIEFVSVHPYHFNRKMVEDWLKLSQGKEILGFPLDSEGNLYIPQKEMDRLMMECMKAVIDKGVRHKWES